MTGSSSSRAVSASLLVEPSPLSLGLPRDWEEVNQWSLTGHQGRPLELLVRGAAGRDVWIFSVSLVREVREDSANTSPGPGLSVIKVTKMAKNPAHRKWD